jgi:type IV pilus assembly protein PilB
MRLRSKLHVVTDQVAEVLDDPTDPVVRAADTSAAPARAPYAAASNAPRVPLGELLVSTGLISPKQLERALAEQESGSGGRLGETLVRNGVLGERDYLETLAGQLGLPLVDLRRVVPEVEALALLPERIVRSEMALPVCVDRDVLLVAISNEPTSELAATLSKASGMSIAFDLALQADVTRAIDRCYSALSGLEHLAETYDDAVTTSDTREAVIEIDENAPIVQVVNRIVTQAVRARASDIHIEAQEERVRVRFRVDGALYDAVSLPSGIAQALVSRIKIMADMNIVERRRAQDGQFEVTVDGQALDVRVATTATITGEKAVLRLLGKSRSMLGLDRLGMPPETRAEFSALIRSPFGMVICAGPTGSGKTTSLYAALGEINSPELNLTTIEDPVEYVVPSINQIQINEQAGITFAGGLRAILRQDPDVILVGEIRDVETAQIAVQSALTGHLVLSSIHAIDSTAALHRFVEMGVPPFLVSSSVIAIVAQRLVRRICSACREPYQPPADELVFYADWGGSPKEEFWHGAGCNFCAHTGYAERIGVYELLKVNEEIRELVVRNVAQDELRAVAVRHGMRTLRDQALRLIEDDVTTVAEVLRTIYVA